MTTITKTQKPRGFHTSIIPISGKRQISELNSGNSIPLEYRQFNEKLLVNTYMKWKKKQKKGKERQWNRETKTKFQIQ